MTQNQKLAERYHGTGIKISSLIRISEAGVTIPDDVIDALDDCHRALQRVHEYVHESPTLPDMADALSDDWRERMERAGAAIAANRYKVTSRAREQVHARVAGILDSHRETLRQALTERFKELLPRFANMDDPHMSRSEHEELTEQRHTFGLAVKALHAGNGWFTDRAHNENLAHWCKFFTFSPEAYDELVHITGPGLELRPSQDFYATALKAGAEPRIAATDKEACENADRYRTEWAIRNKPVNPQTLNDKQNAERMAEYMNALAHKDRHRTRSKAGKA